KVGGESFVTYAKARDYAKLRTLLKIAEQNSKLASAISAIYDKPITLVRNMFEQYYSIGQETVVEANQPALRRALTSSGDSIELTSDTTSQVQLATGENRYLKHKTAKNLVWRQISGRAV